MTDGERSERVAILLVDDEVSLARTVAMHLEAQREAFEVETASDAEAALALLDEHEWDCLVTDYRMPGTDGIELTERVRDIAPDVPIVLYTRVDRKTILEDALAAGVSDYFRKGTETCQYRLLAERIARLVESADAGPATAL